MKKRLTILSAILLLMSTPVFAAEATYPRGLWITVFQDPPLLESREEMDKLIDFAKKSGIQALFVQVYRANKSWFPSKTADDSPYLNNLAKLGEDPLRVFIEKAHASGLQVYAWMNLLSLSANENAAILKRYGPEVLTRNIQPKTDLPSFKIDNQYFLEPGDPRVRRHLSRIVEELAERYPDLDGIQFDYIRYPDRDIRCGYSPYNVSRFKKAYGISEIHEDSKIWKDWKRRQVHELVQLLSYRVRAVRPKMPVAASVLAPYARAYHEAYQEWNVWLEQKWVDFVLVMSYSPDTAQVQRLILDAQKRTAETEKISIGIWAEQKEKIKDLETFASQVQTCQQSSRGACVFLDYGTFLKEPSLAEALTSRSVQS